MSGGLNRKEESLKISSTNVFAALGSLKKKKKSEKDSSKGKSSSSSSSSKNQEKEEEKVFWAPAPLTVKSWADVDDDDDDDYYATTAPPQSVWGGATDHPTEMGKEKESSTTPLEV